MKKFTMYDYLKKFEFSKFPDQISYLDGETLKLNNDFNFFHNKNKFRKELNRLQYTFKKYTGNSLVASGIRDTYIKEKFTEEFLIVLFTTNETIRKTNKIIQRAIKRDFKPYCYYLENNSDYMLLITKKMDALIAGIVLMEELFVQTFEDYLKQEEFDDFVKIRPFLIHNCIKKK